MDGAGGKLEKWLGLFRRDKFTNSIIEHSKKLGFYSKFSE